MRAHRCVDRSTTEGCTRVEHYKKDVLVVGGRRCRWRRQDGQVGKPTKAIVWRPLPSTRHTAARPTAGSFTARTAQPGLEVDLKACRPVRRRRTRNEVSAGISDAPRLNARMRRSNSARSTSRWCEARTPRFALDELRQRNMPVLLDLSSGAVGACKSRARSAASARQRSWFAVVDSRRPDLDD